jgi:hypothetical protein
MKFHLYPIFLVALFAGACSGTAGGPKTSAELAATSPFVVQFTGTYEDPSAGAGSVRWVRIGRDGTFEILVQGAAAPEDGTFGASALHQLPATLELDAGSLGLVTAKITDYDGVLHVTLGGHTAALHADSPVGPNESLCDATHGVWHDDDADSNTGLYCTCRGTESYIPSEGGCIR